MIARSEEGAPRDALFSPPRPATFEVQYPDGRASHSLTLRSYVTDTQAPVGSWVLVERAGATGGLRGASQCCVWPAVRCAPWPCRPLACLNIIGRRTVAMCLMTCWRGRMVFVAVTVACRIVARGLRHIDGVTLLMARCAALLSSGRRRRACWSRRRMCASLIV